MEDIFHTQSGFIGIFVQGSMSFITENINPSKGLANGTTVYMHSLTFSDEDKQSIQYKSFMEKLKCYKGGQHIHVQDIIPTFINVELKMTNELKQFRQTTETLCTNKFIFPIGFRSRIEKINTNITINGQTYISQCPHNKRKTTQS